MPYFGNLARTESEPVSVLNRMRPPAICFPASKKSAGNVLCIRSGKRHSGGALSSNQGKPHTCNDSLGKSSQFIVSPLLSAFVHAHRFNSRVASALGHRPFTIQPRRPRVCPSSCRLAGSFPGRVVICPGLEYPVHFCAHLCQIGFVENRLQPGKPVLLVTRSLRFCKHRFLGLHLFIILLTIILTYGKFVIEMRFRHSNMLLYY